MTEPEVVGIVEQMARGASPPIIDLVVFLGVVSLLGLLYLRTWLRLKRVQENNEGSNVVMAKASDIRDVLDSLRHCLESFETTLKTMEQKADKTHDHTEERIAEIRKHEEMCRKNWTEILNARFDTIKIQLEGIGRAIDDSKNNQKEIFQRLGGIEQKIK